MAKKKSQKKVAKKKAKVKAKKNVATGKVKKAAEITPAVRKEWLEKNEISKDEFTELLRTKSEFFVSVCEMEPSG